MEWKILQANGSPPCPRYGHSLNYFKEVNAIVIYGGRDNNSNEESISLGIFSDIYMLFLDKM